MADDPTPTPTPEPAAPATDPATPADLGDAGKQALDRMKNERDEARRTAKARERELDQLRQSSMTDQEKAIEAAKAEARTATLTEIGGRLVDAELRAAAAGRPIDVDALLEGLDRSKYLTDDGDVDRKALTAWVDRLAPAPTDTAPPVPSFDGGVRTPAANTSTASQFAKAMGPLLT